MRYCKEHKLEEYKLKNGNILKVCITCGLHTEYKEGVPIDIYNELKRRNPKELKQIIELMNNDD